jgi:hypothetical protein
MSMKKLAVLVSLAVVLALVPAQAASANLDVLDSSAGAFPEDEFAALSSGGHRFAAGGGSLAVRGTNFAFSAHLGPDGPSGYAVVNDPTDGEAQGHVCPAGMIFLPGAVAQFWIQVEKGSGTLGLFPFLQVTAADNGGKPPTGAVPDSLVVQGASACTFPGTFGFGAPVDQGNIVVN